MRQRDAFTRAALRLLALGVLLLAVLIGPAILARQHFTSADAPACEVVSAHAIAAHDPVLIGDQAPTHPSSRARTYWRLDCAGHHLLVRADTGGTP